MSLASRSHQTIIRVSELVKLFANVQLETLRPTGIDFLPVRLSKRKVALSACCKRHGFIFNNEELLSPAENLQQLTDRHQRGSHANAGLACPPPPAPHEPFRESGPDAFHAAADWSLDVAGLQMMSCDIVTAAKQRLNFF